MSNQANEDELTKTMMGKLIAELMRWHGDDKEDSSRLASILLPHIEALVRTEKLKLLAEVRGRVVGEDEITYANYEDGFFGGKKVTRDKLRESQRIELTKLEAEL